MANVEFVQTGDGFDYTPSSDVAAGDVVMQGDRGRGMWARSQEAEAAVEQLAGYVQDARHAIIFTRADADSPGPVFPGVGAGGEEAAQTRALPARASTHRRAGRPVAGH